MAAEVGSGGDTEDMLANLKTHSVLRHLGLLLGEQTIGQFPGTSAYS